MSKLIVEMEMPSSCFGCPISIIYGKEMICRLDNARRKCDFAFRPDWCPIKGVLPDEHGDLIDRDELLKECYPDDEFDAHVIYEDDIHKANAVIAAERKNDGK